MPNTSAQSLLSAASIYANNAPNDWQVIKLGLLQQILKSLNPMAATDPQTLITIGAQYANLPPGMLPLIELALLQQISNNGTGGSSGVSSGVGAPVAGTTTGTIYYQTDTQSIWAYNGATWSLIVA